MNFSARLATFTDPDACWLWPGYIRADGYGTCRYRDKPGSLVHRAAYEELVGPIPSGMEIDHLCRVRHCFNPKHLQPVTPKTNSHRSESFSGRNARKTHCKRGHAFDAANTYNYRGVRICRTCVRMHGKHYRQRRQAA